MNEKDKQIEALRDKVDFMRSMLDHQRCIIYSQESIIVMLQKELGLQRDKRRAEGMNIIEALKAAKGGAYVRREDGVCPIFFEKSVFENEPETNVFSVEDIESTNWRVENETKISGPARNMSINLGNSKWQGGGK